MENLFGPKLTSQEGEVDTVTALKDKVVGLYFSAHWCPPCRSFTPELAKTYKLLTEQGKNFEIVFVSSDNDDSGFTEYFNSMPWKALPYSERDRKASLSKKFKVSGIPTLVILDPSGAIITKDGRTQIDGDPEGANFPWVPPEVKDVLGTEFMSKDGKTVTLSELEGHHIAVYFSAHWCPPCKTFTPNLAKVYTTLKDKGVKLEIIFASSDKNEEEFDEYYKEMPWLALPYVDRERKLKLSQKFGVTGIPCLVVLGPDLEIVNPNARNRVSNDLEAAEFPWGAKPLINLDEDPSNINDYVSVLFVKGEGMDEGAAKAMMDKLSASGQEYINKAKISKEDPEFMFFFSNSASGKVTSSVIDAMEGAAQADRPVLVVLDIPEGGKYSVVETDNPTPDMIDTVLEDYKAGKLTMKQLN